MTKALEKQIPRPYATEDKSEEQTLIVAHYFSVWSNWDWYVIEYNPEDKIFFGLVKGFEIELGYFSLGELEQFNNSRSVPMIERDLYWNKISLAELKKQLKQ